MRSLLLFYLLSCLHLFARLLPLRNGSERRNTFVRRVRRSLSGAPILCAFFLVAFMLPVVAAAPSQGIVTCDTVADGSVDLGGPGHTDGSGDVPARDRPPPLPDPPHVRGGASSGSYPCVSEAYLLCEGLDWQGRWSQSCCSHLSGLPFR